MDIISKVYIRDKKEIFEKWENGLKGKILLSRKENELGDSLLSFIYGDFRESFDKMIGTQELLKNLRSKKDIDKTLAELTDIANFLREQHIFFPIISDYIEKVISNFRESGKSGIKSDIDIKYISHIWGDLQILQEKLLKLIIDCLDIEVANDLSVEQRYLKFLSEDDNMTPFKPRILSTNFEIMPEHDYDFERINAKLSQKNLSDLQAKEIPLLFIEALEPKDVFDYIYFFSIHILKNNIKFKKCKNCGKYFTMLGNSNAEYCNRLAENSTKTCKEIGATKIYQAKAFDNPISKEYNKAYKKHFARIKYKLTTKEEFSAWAELARIERDKCIDGQITLEEFKTWLAD